MADAARQLTLAEQTLALAHALGVALEEVEDVLHACHAAHGVFRYNLAQLLHAELHVVEVRNGVAQRLGYVNEHFLEVAKGHTGQVAVLGIDGLKGLSTGNEHHHTPVAVVGVVEIALAVASLHERKHLTIDVFLAASLEFLADVSGYHVDVMLQQVYIGKNGIVDALQHVVGRIA